MKNPIIRIIASFVVAVFACGANGAGLPKDSVAKPLSDKNDAWPVAYRYRDTEIPESRHFLLFPLPHSRTDQTGNQ